jgi:hypothetical protein
MKLIHAARKWSNWNVQNVKPSRSIFLIPKPAHWTRQWASSINFPILSNHLFITVYPLYIKIQSYSRYSGGFILRGLPTKILYAHILFQYKLHTRPLLILLSKLSAPQVSIQTTNHIAMQYRNLKTTFILAKVKIFFLSHCFQTLLFGVNCQKFSES